MIRLLSLALLIGSWQAAAALSDPHRLPGPGRVLATIIEEARSGALFANLAVTLARVAASFFSGHELSGAGWAIVMGRRPLADRLLDPWLVVLLNLPALVIIVLAYVWAGLTETAAIAAVALNKLPKRRGDDSAKAPARSTKPRRNGAGVSAWRLQRLRHIVLPQLAPYLTAATRSGLSLVWKIVLVVELLGRSNGVGFEIGVCLPALRHPLLLA